MRFVSFSFESHESYGLQLGDGAVLDLPLAAKAAGKSLPATLLAFIAEGDGALAIAKALQAAPRPDALRDPAKLKSRAPVPRPAKNVFCVGRNYREHVEEGYRARQQDVKLPDFPQFFTKPPTAVIGPAESFIHDPGITKALDYEVELALVIGKTGRDIPRDQALAHIFGVTVLNDITARDLQRRHDQWFKGKALDRSCPMGPALVTLDEAGDLSALELTTHVNGEPRQKGRVAQMIFDIPEIIAQLSRGMTLEAGDIIATGTPSGVGYAMTPPGLLQIGDTVECAIGGIGTLVTKIIAAGDAA